MRNCVLLSLLMSVACGGGTGTTGTVDPTSEDFCLQWANAVCRLAYICVDTASQDAAFHALYGTGTDNCWSGLEKRCTSNQTGSQAFGPSCGPGKKPDQTAAKTCTDNLTTEPCTDWMTAQSGGCDSVCTATSQPDAGPTTDAASSSSFTDAVGFCTVDWNLTCDRAFECDATNSAAMFGNVAGCKALASSMCAGDPCPTGYSQSNATACIAATKAATCSALLSNQTPAVCTAACGQ